MINSGLDKNSNPHNILGVVSYGNRVATVFDQAAELRIFKGVDEKFYSAGLLSLPIRDLIKKVSIITSRGVNILICGAVSRCALHLLQRENIWIFPWISGEIEQVMAALTQQRLPEFIMPGCPNKMSGKHRHCNGKKRTPEWRKK